MRIRLQQWSEPKKPSKGSLLTKKETLPPRRAFFDSSVLPLIMISVCFSFRVPLMRKCLQFLGWNASSAASITPRHGSGPAGPLMPSAPHRALRRGRDAGQVPPARGQVERCPGGAACAWGSPRRLPRLLSPLRCARGRRNWAEILGSVGNLGFAWLFAVAAWWPPQDGAGPRAVPPPGLMGTKVRPPATSSARARGCGAQHRAGRILLQAEAAPATRGPGRAQPGRSRAAEVRTPPSPPPPPL